MKGAVVDELRAPVVLQEVEIAAPGPREVLVDVVACGVCHSDLHAWTGAQPAALPTILGHEPAGVVRAVGDEVTSVRIGDHVVGTLSAWCGACEYCISGRLYLCGGRGTARGADEPPRLRVAGGADLHQTGGLSGFAEQMLTHERALVPIDTRMPLVPASILGCGVMTGFGAAVRTAAVGIGDTVAVVGLGGVGLSAVQGARVAGAARIVALDTQTWKLELAARVGATDTVLVGGEDDPARAVRRITAGGVDVALDCVGSNPTLQLAFAATRMGGRTVLVGAFPQGRSIELPGNEFIMRGKSLLGSSMGANRAPHDIPAMVGLYLDGRLLLDEMVAETFALEDVNDVFARVLDASVARAVFIFDQS